MKHTCLLIKYTHNLALFCLIIVYFIPSPSPNKCGGRFGAKTPFSWRFSNISSAFKTAWSMLKYLYDARRPTKATFFSCGWERKGSVFPYW